jgi:hypothetical protein
MILAATILHLLDTNQSTNTNFSPLARQMGKGEHRKLNHSPAPSWRLLSCGVAQGATQRLSIYYSDVNLTWVRVVAAQLREV